MADKPVAAGKSSLDHVDRELAFANIISPDAKAYLDLACGAGRYTLALAERIGEQCAIHALDLWEGGIAALKDAAREKGFSNIRAMVADVTRPLPLEDGSVDVCFIATVLHDLPADARPGVMGEIRRVLRPRGKLVVIEFKKSDQGPGPRKEKRLDASDIEALAAPQGFKKEFSIDLGVFTYLIRLSL